MQNAYGPHITYSFAINYIEKHAYTIWCQVPVSKVGEFQEWHHSENNASQPPNWQQHPAGAKSQAPIPTGWHHRFYSIGHNEKQDECGHGCCELIEEATEFADDVAAPFLVFADVNAPVGIRNPIKFLI